MSASSPMESTGLVVPLKTIVADGAIAGDITATGIALLDTLAAVIVFTGGDTDITAIVDLTSEFSITAADTINNTGGTSTASSQLLIFYFDNPNA